MIFVMEYDRESDLPNGQCVGIGLKANSYAQPSHRSVGVGGGRQLCRAWPIADVQVLWPAIEGPAFLPDALEYETYMVSRH